MMDREGDRSHSPENFTRDHIIREREEGMLALLSLCEYSLNHAK